MNKKYVTLTHTSVQLLQSGKVIYVGNIPPFKGSDALLLKIAEPFGKIRRYFLNPLRSEVIIKM